MLPFLEYYNVLEWERRFTLRLNTQKIRNQKMLKKLFRLNFLQKTQWTYMGEYFNSTHIRFFFAILKVSFSIFFFEHVVDEFWKTNPRLVFQKTPRPSELGGFCLLRWNSCSLWRNYRTLWWNHHAIPYIMAQHSMDFWYVEVASL